MLKSPPEFVYAPSDAVKSCAIVGMQLRDCRLGKFVAINLSAPNSQKESSTKVIYDQLNKLFGSALQNQVELSSVTLQMKILQRYGNGIKKKIRLSESGMQNIDFGETDGDIHKFLIANGLERCTELQTENAFDKRA